MRVGRRVEPKVRRDVPSFCSVISRTIKRNINGFLGSGIVCEYWARKVIGIISMVKAEQAIETLRRGETHGFSLER